MSEQCVCSVCHPWPYAWDKNYEVDWLSLHGIITVPLKMSDDCISWVTTRVTHSINVLICPRAHVVLVIFQLRVCAKYCFRAIKASIIASCSKDPALTQLGNPCRRVSWCVHAFSRALAVKLGCCLRCFPALRNSSVQQENLWIFKVKVERKLISSVHVYL